MRNLRVSIFINIFCLLSLYLPAAKAIDPDTTATSTQQQALYFLSKITKLETSNFWPSVKAAEFLQNIKMNVETPLSVYEGSNTNFCGYAALTYFPLHIDPLGYVKFMLKVYNEGKATYGKAFFNPSPEIKKAAGTLRFKGILDIRPADQLWFLILADHFKGYVNFFNKKYDPEDENTFWASVNYAKFNRMIKTLFNVKIHARGSDLMHPLINNLYAYISNSMKTGITVVYLNNAYLYRRKHNMLRPGIPTHYVILLNMTKSDDLINITYWDYGFRSLRQITPAFLKKIVFGISHCTKKTMDAPN